MISDNEQGRVVYKSAGKNNDYIVKMTIPGDAITNEKRNNVIDLKHARFRTNRVFVCDIYHKFTKESVDSISSNHDENFVYRKGEIKEENNFDENLCNTCTYGIHYYLTEETAFYHNRNLNLGNYSGRFYGWNENGQLAYEGEYKNGKQEGLWKILYSNGNPKYEGECKNGKEEGLWMEWYEDGQLQHEGEFKNGEEEGLWKGLHYNGNPKYEGK
jgi:antitoxin component YwqK of YwqJK toxin-antitoxin module